jgi:hypothetical protein
MKKVILGTLALSMLAVPVVARADTQVVVRDKAPTVVVREKTPKVVVRERAPIVVREESETTRKCSVGVGLLGVNRTCVERTPTPVYETPSRVTVVD